MKETEMEKTLLTDPELDAGLAKMAEEVPSMPADFHDKWMNAVRAEAHRNTPDVEGKPVKKIVSVTRWTRILSTAAVFIFLIGGTLLYRQSKKDLFVPMSTENRKSAAAVSEQWTAAETDAEAPAEAMAAEAAEPVMEAEVKAAAPAAAAGARKEVSAETKGFLGVNTAGASLEEPMMAAVNTAEEAVEEAAEESADLEMTMEYEADSFAVNDDMAEPEPVPVPTAMPTESQPEEKTVSEEPAEENGFFREAGVFLKDMGDFLLAALPYLAILAVPAAAALIFQRRKRH